MVYKLIITKRAEYLVDNLIGYILFNLKNQEAAIHLRNSVDKTITRIKENPYQFSRLIYKNYDKREYRGAIVENMKYIIVYKIVEDTIYIMGIFHTKEKFHEKI